jgi:chondroitin AC lyase
MKARRAAANIQSRPLRLENLETRATPSVDLATNMVTEIMEDAPYVLVTAASNLQKMRADGSFADLNYKGRTDASANDMQAHGLRVLSMAQALKWNDPSNSLFNNTALKDKILKSFNYLATKAGTVNAPNWWWKAIGVPQGISDGLMLMRNDLTATVRNKVMSKYFSSVWQPTKYDGANLAYQAPMAILDGLIRNKPTQIKSVVSKMSAELSAYSGEGIQRDLSFHQHRAAGKPSYHSGSYGMVLAHRTARIMRWTDETPYAFGQAAIEQEVRYTLDGLAWLTRGEAFDLPSQGRAISREDWATAIPYRLRETLIDLSTLGHRTDDLARAIDRYDNGVDETNALSGNISFYKSDAMANQRLELLTTVKLISSRITRPETAAGEGKLAFFMGDGFTMFVQDGDEFGTLAGPEVMPVWDWQRLPGTTVEHTGVIPYYDMFKTGTHALGKSTLVGSVSDGFYGLSAMDYARSGVSVTAKKAYFFFDTEVVALGADIDSSSKAAPVFTSINQVLQDGSVIVKDAAGQRTLQLGDAASLSGTGWVVHDGLGYVIIDPTSQTTVQAKLQSGGGLVLPVFSAWIDHGKTPQNATYAYIVIPDVTVESLTSYLQAPPLKILSNTANIQAVQNTTTGVTQIAFYSAGTLEIEPGFTIKVDKAANLIVKRSGSAITITAADPLQKASSINIDISRRLTGTGASLLADGTSTRITFALPASPTAGASVTRSFQVIGTAATMLSSNAVDQMMSQLA